MKKQIILLPILFLAIGTFAQVNREALIEVKKSMSDAKSYNIALIWLDQKETDRNPVIKKEILSIFPELINKELNQKAPDITIQVIVDKPQIISERNTTSVVTNNAQGHEVQLDYELPARMIVSNQLGKRVFESKLNELQKPLVFKESYKYSDNNGTVTVNPKTKEPTQLRSSIKGYDPLNSSVNSTEYFKISTKKQTNDLRSLLNAWQSYWSINKTIALK